MWRQQIHMCVFFVHASKVNRLLITKLWFMAKAILMCAIAHDLMPFNSQSLLIYLVQKHL